MRRFLRKAQQEECAAQEPKRDELAIVEAMLTDCEKEVTDCAAALVKASGAVGRALEEKAHEVNARFDALTRRRDELKAEIAARKVTEEAIDAALRFRQDVFTGTQNPSFEMKRRVLEVLGVEVKVSGTRFWVNFRVGTCPAVFDFQTF